MADENTPRALPKKFDPDRYYRVQLSKPVPFAGMTLSPGKQQTMGGDMAESLRDSIASAEVVTDGDGYEEAR